MDITGPPTDITGPSAGPRATARALARVGGASAIVVVEGLSDQIALETLAVRRGRNLAAEGVVVVPIGGAHAAGRFVARLGPRGMPLAGLCDAGEADIFRRNLAGARLSVCVADLEDELIRAVGVPAVEALLETHGDLGALRSLQRQPAWRGQPAHAQLRRFLGAGARRKLRYARLLVEAVDLGRVPQPLDGVLADAGR